MTTLRRIILALAAALAVLLFFAVAGWAGGFDFDNRSPAVGEITAMSMFLALIAASMVYAMTEQGPKP